jgi:hypothetical protein
MAHIILKDIVREILTEASSSGGIIGVTHGQTVAAPKVTVTLTASPSSNVKSKSVKGGDGDNDGDVYNFFKYKRDNAKFGTSNMSKK